MNRACSFEVSVEVSGKPEIEGVYQEERQALARAEYLLKQAKYTAVRVYRVNARDEHKVIFEKFYSGAGVGSTISSIDDAFLCTSLSDVYSFDSRMTLIRLIRSYFDQQVMIPLELLHNYMNLRYLERDALLFSQAGHRLAALQARQAKVSTDARHEALLRLYREVVEQAKESERLASYAEGLATKGLSGLVQTVTSALPVGEHSRVITYAIARYLQEARDWSLKLTAACELFEDGQSEAAGNWLDEVLAETIDGNAPIKAVMGYAPNLAAALEALLAVADGSLDDRLPGTEPLQKLSDIMADRPLPRVRAALLGRVTAALDGKAPLTKLDRAANGEALKRLLPKLQDFGGFMGGVPMCAALTRRAKVDFGTPHEDLSFETTVATLSGFLPSPAARIGYQLDLLGSDQGRRRASFLTQVIAEQFSALRSIHDFAPDLDSSWSQDMVREDFRRRLYRAGIPRRLADGLLNKLQALQERKSLAPSGPADADAVTMAPVTVSRVGQLVLTYRGARHVVAPSETPFTIGRGENCRLIVDWGTASRAHAVIQVEGDDFILLDQSKNGTFIRNDDQKTVALAKTSTVLSGRGTITIGIVGNEPDASERAVIGFQRVPGGVG